MPFRPFRFVTAPPRVRIRLAITAGSLLALSAVMLLTALRAFGALEVADAQQAEVDAAKLAVSQLTTRLREEDAHQAHTIIEFLHSGAVQYDGDAAALTGESVATLLAFSRTPRGRGLTQQIASLVQDTRDRFLTQTLSAIRSADVHRVASLHRQSETSVQDAALRLDELNGIFAARSREKHADADRQQRIARVTLVSCFLIGALFSVALSFICTTWFDRRMKVLLDGVAQLGTGDLNAEIVLDGSDEIARLATAFNEMASRIQVHQRQVLQSQKLAAVGRLCAGVAHEVNEPLGIVLGYASLIRRHGLDAAAIAAIEDEARQCKRIVEVLLDVSRESKPCLARILLAPMARECVERLETSGRLAQRQVAVLGESGAIWGDEPKLRQVFLNVIANAIDATAPDGHVDIRVFERGARAVVAIEDDGCGLAAGPTERLFDAFVTTKEGGTGLGLAICRAIVEAHGGSIAAFDRAPSGTRIEISLDLGRVAEGAS